MFIHCPPVELLEIKRENVNGKRHYATPDGKFPSITSVLGAFPKPELYEWRKRIGETEANKITRTSSSRGTSFHTICETYLNNETIDKTKFKHDALESFYSVKQFLNRINNIHQIEIPVYSKKLQVAGTCDTIAEFDGVLSIIDYKSSRREKNEDDILDYFIQTTFYGLSYAEMTGLVAKKIVIIMAVDDGLSKIFIKDIKDYVQPTIKKIHQYKNLYA